MSSEVKRKIIVEGLEAMLPVGIYDFEKTPQRVIVDAEIEGMFPEVPMSIADCFNYEIVHRRVTQDWAQNGHTDLLETLADDLLDTIFAADARVTRARVHVRKPDIFKNAASVGVELERERNR